MKNSLKLLSLVALTLVLGATSFWFGNSYSNQKLLTGIASQSLSSGPVGPRIFYYDESGNVVIYPVDRTLSIASATLNAGTTTVAGFTQGNGVFATSSGSGTLTEAILLENNVIDYNQSIVSATLTLPATSTMTTLIPNAGDFRQWVIRSATTTSSQSFTVAAGAGMDLQEPDGQNVVIGTTNFAWITMYRKSDGDVIVKVDETIPAD